MGCLPAPSWKSNGELIHACIWKRIQWMCYRCVYTTQSTAMLRLQVYSYRVQAWMGTHAQQGVTLYIIMQHTSAQIQVKTFIWCCIFFFAPTNSKLFFKTHWCRLNQEVKCTTVDSFLHTHFVQWWVCCDGLIIPIKHPTSLQLWGTLTLATLWYGIAQLHE